MSTTDGGQASTWLSQDAFNRLQAELDELIANRPAVAAEINARREEGDLRENGGYHAAREEQGKQEGRILYLKDFLRTAHVGEDPDDTETFLLGSREISSTTELTVYSPESALGRAILDAKRGDAVTYTAPSGAEIKVTILSFEPFGG